MSASKMDENPDTYCVRMPMQSTPRERIMEREDSPIDPTGAAAVRTEALQPDRPKAVKIGEGIHDTVEDRLLPLRAAENPRRSL